MQNQLTVSFSVLPSCAQQHPSRHHHHWRTPHTSSSPSRSRTRPCWSTGIFGFKCCWAKCRRLRLRLRRRGGGVCARPNERSWKCAKIWKEGSERRLRGDAGFANKANPPTAGSGQPPAPPPPGTAEEGSLSLLGREEEGEGAEEEEEEREGGEREEGG
jgi:hypothetical protein